MAKKQVRPHEDYYHDDPVKPVVKRKNYRSLSSAVMLIVAGLFINNTLAANISLTGGGGVEFGQGISMTTACSGSQTLTVTPQAQFVNSTGAGSYYFKSVRVSGIPSSCDGLDFQISAYNSTGGALPLFNSTSTVATIYQSSGSYSAGVGGTDLSVSSSSGAFTVSFDVPVALSSTVARLTLQSGPHVPITYSIGQRGPGGGIVFYIASGYFTSTGSTCGSSCKYLEYAPSTWRSGSVADDLTYQWSTNTSTATGQDISTATSEGFDSREKTNWKIGQGFNNTSLMQVSGATSSARNAVLAFAGNDGSAGQWFIPSTNELNELCKYAFGQNTGNPKVACSYSGSSFKSTARTGGDLGGFVGNFYWASTEQSAGVAMVTYFDNPVFQDIGNKTQNQPIRPIRAF